MLRRFCQGIGPADKPRVRVFYYASVPQDPTVLALWVTAGAAVATAFATVVLAFVTWLNIRKLDQAHEHAIEPHIQWEGPRRAANPPGAGIAEVSVNARNVGAGPARVTKSRITTGLGEELAFRGLSIPTTLPSGQPYTFYVDYTNFTLALSNSAGAPVPLTIAFDYTDVESRRCYRTEVSVNLTQHLENPMAGPIDFLQTDERPARKRKVKCTS